MRKDIVFVQNKSNFFFLRNLYKVSLNNPTSLMSLLNIVNYAVKQILTALLVILNNNASLVKII